MWDVVMNKIGVFLCHCDLKVAGNMNLEEVLDQVRKHKGVTYAAAFRDRCLDLGLATIRDAIKEHHLDGVVITSCAPSLHREGFVEAVLAAGLEPYQMKIVNLKDVCGWPNTYTEQESTEKTVSALIDAVDEVKRRKAASTSSTPITKRALVIGGGIAGIQASLDIADGGYEVLLVEKTTSIGGHMIQYSEVFPTLDCPQCIETPKMTECGQHPNIKLLAYSEVEKVEGQAGDFTVTIRRKASYVDWEKCTGCGVCQEKCPTKVPAEFQRWLPFGPRKAIYVPFPQAVPNKPAIDANSCRYLIKGKCGLCIKECPTGAINFEQKDTFIEEKVGAIVIATGFELMPKKDIPEYADDPDILEGIAFERILCPGGPTAGAVKRPSDSKEPKQVVFVGCCGSRDPEHGVPYCSRVCCMYLTKMAMLYKHAVHDGQAYMFYIDLRTTGKGYEEFVQRAVEDYGLMYLRGKVSKIFREGEKLRVFGSDTLSGKSVEISCDMVVLGMAMLSSPGIKDLAKKLGVDTDDYGFISEIHPKLRPLETSVPGIFVCGTAQGPKDIPDSVSQGGAVGSKVLRLFSQDKIVLDKVAVG
jgi:heterodisulfide reductase subunit A